VPLNTVEEVKVLLDEVLQLGGRADGFTAETPLLGSVPEFDSMAVVSVITAMEERYDVAVDDDEMSAEVFETVGSLARFLDEKLQSAA